MPDIGLPQKITDDGEERGQVDSGVEVGYDSPTGSVRLQSSKVEGLSTVESSGPGTCQNGDITLEVCINVPEGVVGVDGWVGGL